MSEHWVRLRYAGNTVLVDADSEECGECTYIQYGRHFYCALFDSVPLRTGISSQVRCHKCLEAELAHDRMEIEHLRTRLSDCEKERDRIKRDFGELLAKHRNVVCDGLEIKEERDALKLRCESAEGKLREVRELYEKPPKKFIVDGYVAWDEVAKEAAAIVDEHLEKYREEP